MNKTLKEKLNTREVTIGAWITLNDLAVAEIITNACPDWVVVDMEHSALSFSQAQEIIRVVSLSSIPVLIRVMDHNPESIKKFMDMGATGIIAPRVNSRDEAKIIVDSVKYPPFGKRGVGLFRAQKYSLNLKNYERWNLEKSVIILQVETAEGIKNFDQIRGVEGVDGYMIGPYDLSASIGCSGEFDHPKVKKIFQIIEERVKSKSEAWGYHVVDPDEEIVLEKIKQGYSFIAYGVDFIFFNNLIKNKFESLRNQITESPKC